MMQTQYHPMPLILLAAFSGNLSLVRLLLARDPLLMGARDRSGTNLLHLIEDEELFKEVVLFDKSLLLERDSKNQTVVELILLRFSEDFLLWLFEKEPELLYLQGNYYQELPIHTLFAEKEGKMQLLHWMIEKDSKLLEAQDDQGKLPLHYATRYGCLAQMHWTLKRYPTLFLKQDFRGYLPMHYCSWGREESSFFLALFQHFPELVQHEDQDGMRPLHYFCQAGNQELAELMLDLEE